MKNRNYIIATIVILLLATIAFFMVKRNTQEEAYEKVDEVKNAFIELDEATIAQSGFVNDIGVSQVIQNCTQCHSSKLVTQNRLNEAGWKATIEWMQETQNLWDLGKNEDRIVTYLAKNYGPTKKGRRENLDVTEWYKLK